MTDQQYHINRQTTRHNITTGMVNHTHHDINNNEYNRKSILIGRMCVCVTQFIVFAACA